MKPTLLCLLIFLQTACTGLPNNITPVSDFNLQSYLGTWYEIARLDHSFERGLSQVTAIYSIKPDGGVSVLNKGYNENKNKWNTAEGKAYFVGDETTGHLKVSFFGPFYSSYVVFNLDKENYQYAYVAGFNNDYLWLLARTPEVSDEIKNNFIQTAKSYGFNVNEIIFVAQSKTN
jgi:apolipoprotein D and lipocalin family protein